MLEKRKNKGVGESEPKFERPINSSFTFRNDFGFACKPAEMMTSIAVVRFDGCSVLLANDMPVLGQNLGESLPAVCIEDTVGEMPHFGVESFDSFLTAASKHPRNCSLCRSVNCFDDPQLSFFLPI